ncbi:hypothetical protein OG948_57215 (plasmid) [Embleya sp. NBC_00888]|uniref:hypothetical protein n=1 Tax=Embleya sp. NBC_00888 TaxID=2975960 RepID=UPI002F90FF66|nr:hypothetical protein OG948_57215 [Embleya sp. NBC_00888]
MPDQDCELAHLVGIDHPGAAVGRRVVLVANSLVGVGVMLVPKGQKGIANGFDRAVVSGVARESEDRGAAGSQFAESVADRLAAMACVETDRDQQGQQVPVTSKQGLLLFLLLG